MMKSISTELEFETKISKTEHPVPVVDGVHLHSIYNPLREAESLVNQNETQLKEHSRILVFGLGFGYHIKQIEYKMKTLHGDKYQIFVLEPNSKILAECLKKDLIRPHERLKIINHHTIGEYYQNRELLNFMVERPAILPHPASFNLYNQFFKNFMSFKSSTDMKTVSSFIQNPDLANYLNGEYGATLLDETLETISQGEFPMNQYDYLLMSFKEIVMTSQEKA